MVIKYQIGSGIVRQQNLLQIFDKNKNLVAEAEYDHDDDQFLEDFENFKLTRYFPDHEFSLTGEKVVEDVVLDLEGAVSDIGIGGDISIGEKLDYWEAERSSTGIVIDQSYRPWVEEINPELCWRQFLPGVLIDNYDPVFVKRVALFIERSIYERLKGNVKTVRLKSRINNTFSSTRPIWPENVPPIERF